MNIDKFPRHALQTLAELASPAVDLYAEHPDGSGLRRLSYSFGGDKRGLCLAPDGQSVLYLQDGGIVLHALDSHREVTLLVGNRETGYYVRDCHFTPDGKRLLFAAFHAGSMAILRMDLDSQQIHPLIQQGGQFALLPEGKGIVYAAGGGRWNSYGTLYQADAEGGNRHRLPVAGNRLSGLRCSANGALLLANLQYYVPTPTGMNQKSAIVSYVLAGDDAGKCYETPAEQRTASLTEKHLEDVSPDGQTILFSVPGVKADYRLMHYDLTGERPVPAPSDAQHFRFAPDGTHLLFELGDATFALTLDTFTISPSPPVPALLTPDGKYTLCLQ